MKTYKFIIILICIVIATSFLQRIIMEYLLPDYKGSITSHEAITSQSLALDKNIMESLWSDYSESLPSFTSTQEYLASHYKEGDKDIVEILTEINEKAKPKNLDDMYQSIKYNSQNGKSIFLKDYEYQTIDEKTFILNYIHSHNNASETIYCYVQPKTGYKPNKEERDKSIDYLNRVNEYGYQNLYHIDMNNHLSNPFLKIDQVINDMVNWSLLPSSMSYSKDLISAHFYTMADENEIFMIYQPSDENQDTSLILIFNIELQDISGFIFSKK